MEQASSDLICYAPVDHVLGGLAAAGTGICQVLLLKGDAAGGHAGLFLHVKLALEIAAPHGLDEAAVGLLQLVCLLQRVGSVAVLVQIALCLVEQTLLNIVKQLRQLLLASRRCFSRPLPPEADSQGR